MNNHSKHYLMELFSKLREISFRFGLTLNSLPMHGFMCVREEQTSTGAKSCTVALGEF